MVTASNLLLLLAVLMQGMGAMLILLVLGRRRLPLVANKKIALRDIALSDEPWPEDAKKASNAFNNQFQLPVLFFVGVGIAIYLGAGLFEVLLGWAFVVSRSVHAFIHLTSNNVERRFLVYTFGFALLSVFWLWMVLRILQLLVTG